LSPKANGVEYKTSSSVYLRFNRNARCKEVDGVKWNNDSKESDEDKRGDSSDGHELDGSSVVGWMDDDYGIHDRTSMTTDEPTRRDRRRTLLLMLYARRHCFKGGDGAVVEGLRGMRP
jgi:hypothetical protein